MTEQKYIPALRFHWLTDAYDKLIAFTFPEKEIKNDVIQQAGIQPGETVLDFGVGTATLSIMACQQQPAANYFGVDVDEHILKIAEKKINEAKATIHLTQYEGSKLPYPDDYFDTVISCLVFHHLSTATKRATLLEIRRVLKPQGKLIIADFGKGQTPYAKAASHLISWFDGIDNTTVNKKGLLPSFVQEADFKPVEVIRNYNTVFGTMQLLSGNRV